MTDIRGDRKTNRAFRNRQRRLDALTFRNRRGSNGFVGSMNDDVKVRKSGGSWVFRKVFISNFLKLLISKMSIKTSKTDFARVKLTT